MDFIFDEFIEIKFEENGAVNTVYIKASEVTSIETRTIDTCNVILTDTAYYTNVKCSASVMKFKVDEARARQARKLDNIIYILRRK